MKEKEDKNGYSLFAVILITVLIITTYTAFYLIHLQLPYDRFDRLVDNFNKIAVGIAALVALFVGQSWVNIKREKDKTIKDFLRKFPHDNFGKDWEIVEPESLPGAYYVYDMKRKQVHHILNMKTVYDLGWHIYLNTSKKITDKVFRKIKVGDRIRTQGEAGE